MQYIYEMCSLFPEDSIGGIDGSEHDLKPSQVNKGEDF